jgi:hypothetical protein
MLIQESGNKKDNVTVIYTPWLNLKKDGSMAVGQVSFKDSRKVCALTHSRANFLRQRALGEENHRTAKREPNCQSTEQNQGGEIPRPSNGERGEIEGVEKERAVCKTGACKCDTCCGCWKGQELITRDRKKKRQGLHKRERKRNGRRITLMMTFSLGKMILRRLITKTEKTWRKISCSEPILGALWSFSVLEEAQKPKDPSY